MIIVRRKKFSGYSETPIGGTTYFPAQVTTKLVLDPLEHVAGDLERIPIEPLKKKSSRIKNIVRPLKKILRGKNDN